MSLSQSNEVTGSFVRVEPSLASVGDYVALMKPRVMSLVVFTALVGLVLAPGQPHPVIAFTALLCIAVGAGAAGALNMWYDADIDARMARTAARPIPAGTAVNGAVANASLKEFDVAEPEQRGHRFFRPGRAEPRQRR